MKNNLACELCHQTLTKARDYRLAWCGGTDPKGPGPCRVSRCGECGGVLSGGPKSTYFLDSVWPWILPKRIYDYFNCGKTWYQFSCQRCPLAFPRKRFVFAYLRWEVIRLWRRRKIDRARNARIKKLLTLPKY